MKEPKKSKIEEKKDYQGPLYAPHPDLIRKRLSDDEEKMYVDLNNDGS